MNLLKENSEKGVELKSGKDVLTCLAYNREANCGGEESRHALGQRKAGKFGSNYWTRNRLMR